MVIFIIVGSVVVLGIFLLAIFLGGTRRRATQAENVPAPKVGDNDTTR